MTSRLNNDADSAVELHRLLTASITRHYGLTEMVAAALADDIASELRKEAGGTEIYIPQPSRAARNQDIRNDFDGSNIDGLAMKYSLSRRQIERIVFNSDTPPLQDVAQS